MIGIDARPLYNFSVGTDIQFVFDLVICGIHVLIGAVVCLHAAPQVELSASAAMDGRIICMRYH